MRTFQYRQFRMIGYPIVALLLYLVLILLNPYETTIGSWRFYLATDFLLELGYCLLLAVIFLESGYQLNNVFNRLYPWSKGIKKRIVFQIFSHIGIIYLFLLIFSKVPFPSHFGYDDLLLRQTTIMAMIVCILSTAIFTTEYYFHQWTFAEFKTLRLEKYNTQARLNALNLQLDPHFLFNNLSAVNALIADQPDVASAYVAKLSAIYRYMLSQRNQHVVTLHQELDFIKDYLFLYHIRYGNAIQVSIESSANDKEYGLPPLTLQLLIENAIKHNSFTLSNPLHINIYFQHDAQLTIENNIQRKQEKVFSEKVGLQNIIERYQLLGIKTPEITHSATNFKVDIQLITV